jgi:hypothetical protein
MAEIRTSAKLIPFTATKSLCNVPVRVVNRLALAYNDR